MATSAAKNISARDMEILYRHACGMKNKDIAEDLQVTAQTVCNTLNSPWAKNELALLHARTMDQIVNGTYSPLALARAHSNEALAIQIALMRSPAVKANVRARIADSILDRGGYKPATRIENLDLNDIFDQMSPEELDEYASSGALPDRFSGTQISRFLGKANHDLIAEYTTAKSEPESKSKSNSESSVESIDPRTQFAVIEIDVG